MTGLIQIFHVLFCTFHHNVSLSLTEGKHLFFYRNTSISASLHKQQHTVCSKKGCPLTPIPSDFLMSLFCAFLAEQMSINLQCILKKFSARTFCECLYRVYQKHSKSIICNMPLKSFITANYSVHFISPKDDLGQKH